MGTNAEVLRFSSNMHPTCLGLRAREGANTQNGNVGTTRTSHTTATRYSRRSASSELSSAVPASSNAMVSAAATVLSSLGRSTRAALLAVAAAAAARLVLSPAAMPAVGCSALEGSRRDRALEVSVHKSFAKAI